MAIQRFYEGVNSVSADNPVGMLPYLDPTTWAVWMEDFVLIPEVTSHWLHTQTNGTLGAASTGGCGIMTQTCAGADNDLSQMALKYATIALASGKKTIFEAKVYIDKGAAGTLGEAEVFVGLSTVQVGGNFTAADGLTMTADNCVGFWSPDGTANVSAIVRVADVESIQTPATTYADVTWTVLSFYFDGTSIQFYKNDSLVAKLTAFPTAALCPTIYVKCGEAKPAAIWTDYILVARER